MISTQTEVRTLLDSQAAAMRAKDIDRVMSCYADDIVYFDVVPPLEFAGAAALRKRFLEWFARYDGPLEMEFRNLHMVVNGDVAFAHRFSRAGGTLKDGRRLTAWARATSCCQRTAGGWVVTHEHVSWPVDPESGRAVLNAEV
jgi:ketosteroid isomerase-like protein